MAFCFALFCIAKLIKNLRISGVKISYLFKVFCFFYKFQSNRKMTFILIQLPSLCQWSLIWLIFFYNVLFLTKYVGTNKERSIKSNRLRIINLFFFLLLISDKKLMFVYFSNPDNKKSINNLWKSYIFKGEIFKNKIK